MPMGFPRHGLASGLAYRAQPGDIFVSAYPKCGTTWTQHIVYLLLHEGRPLGPGQRLTEAFPIWRRSAGRAWPHGRRPASSRPTCRVR